MLFHTKIKFSAYFGPICDLCLSGFHSKCTLVQSEIEKRLWKNGTRFCIFLSAMPIIVIRNLLRGNLNQHNRDEFLPTQASWIGDTHRFVHILSIRHYVSKSRSFFLFSLNFQSKINRKSTAAWTSEWQNNKATRMLNSRQSMMSNRLRIVTQFINL